MIDQIGILSVCLQLFLLTNTEGLKMLVDLVPIVISVVHLYLDSEFLAGLGGLGYGTWLFKDTIRLLIHLVL